MSDNKIIEGELLPKIEGKTLVVTEQPSIEMFEELKKIYDGKGVEYLNKALEEQGIKVLVHSEENPLWMQLHPMSVPGKTQFNPFEFQKSEMEILSKEFKGLTSGFNKAIEETEVLEKAFSEGTSMNTPMLVSLQLPCLKGLTSCTKWDRHRKKLERQRKKKNRK